MSSITTSPPPRSPPRLRFVDPTADIVWAAIQTLDEAAKHEVLGHLRTHLDVPDARQTQKQAQVAKSVSALREAAAIRDQRGLAGALTTGAYEALRSEMDRKGDWPTESSIRRFVAGTWNDALRRAQLDPVADGDASRVPLGADVLVAAGLAADGEIQGPLPTAQDESVRSRGGYRWPDELLLERCM